MKKRLLCIISLIAFCGIFQSCDMIFDVASGVLNSTIGLTPVDASTVKGRANIIANEYLNYETAYVPGGFGSRAIPFDCSGFVIRCYLEAVEGTNKKLTFEGRTNVSSLYTKYTRKINKGEVSKGDLIFIDFSKSKGQWGTYPTHVAIVDDIKNSKVYYIDSSDYNASASHSVKKRNIDENDGRIMGYGEMILKDKTVF